MAVRHFDGDDQVSFAIGALSDATGAGTFLILLKRTAVSWATALSINGTGSSQLIFFGFNGDNTPNRAYHVTNVSDEVVGPAAPGFPTADGWIGYALRKATGLETVRVSKYVLGTDTWTHADSTDQNVDGSSPGGSGVIKIGAKDTGFDFFTGRVAASAYWKGVELSDGTLESIILSAADWLAETPDWMALLNQASTATAIEDVTGGGGDQSAITGTSVITDDDPPGFDFSLDAGAEVEGSGVGAFGGLGSATGQPRTLGAGVGSFGALGTATGVRRRLGSGVATWGGLGQSTGLPKKLGAGVAGFGGLGSATGQPTTLGAGAGLFGFTGTAAGSVQGVKEGSGSGDFGFTGTATGQPFVTGSGAGSWGFTGTATGQPFLLGSGAGAWGGLGAAQGLRRVHGAGIGSWGFLGAAEVPTEVIPGRGHAHVGATPRTAYVDERARKVTVG